MCVCVFVYVFVYLCVGVCVYIVGIFDALLNIKAAMLNSAKHPKDSC